MLVLKSEDHTQTHSSKYGRPVLDDECCVCVSFAPRSEEDPKYDVQYFRTNQQEPYGDGARERVLSFMLMYEFEPSCRDRPERR